VVVLKPALGCAKKNSGTSPFLIHFFFFNHPRTDMFLILKRFFKIDGKYAPVYTVNTVVRVL
jgi:hypothetical protein